eukprot:1122101-Prymnesium_polylepis.1
MEGGGVPHPPFATLAGWSAAPPRCPRVPAGVTAGVPDGVCNGRETAKQSNHYTVTHTLQAVYIR